MFEHALPFADVLEMTLVHVSLEGDTHMPPVDWSLWRLESEGFHGADERHTHGFTHRRFGRRQVPAVEATGGESRRAGL